MTLTINDTTMTSDQTAHTARQAPALSRDGKCPGYLARPSTATPPSPP
jgi:hypothetical protein